MISLINVLSLDVISLKVLLKYIIRFDLVFLLIFSTAFFITKFPYLFLSNFKILGEKHNIYINLFL